MANANPFAAFQAGAAAAPVAPQNVGQPGNPFGGPPAQQPPQQPMAPQQPVGFAGAPVQQPVAQPMAPGVGYALPDLSDVGESGRDPEIPMGLSRLLFKANLLKTRQGHTAIAQFSVVTSEDTSKGPGSQVGFVKKLPAERDKQKTAIGYMLPMVRALAGYNDEATFKLEVPYWSQLLAAFVNGDPKFAQWAAGREVGTRGTQGQEIIDKKTGLRTGRYYTQVEWFPIPKQ